MKTLDRYIAKQTLTATLFAIGVLCGVFLLGTIFKEVRPLFIGQNPSMGLIAQFIFNVIPFSLMFTIPWGFLVAILLTFGRLSADNEIVAMRMAGHGLPRIALPVILLGVIFSAISLWLNTDRVPRSKAEVKNVLYEVIRTDPNKLLTPGVVTTHFDDKRIYVERREGNHLFGLHIHSLPSSGQSEDSADTEDSELPLRYLYAKQAELFVDEENKQLRLKLIDASFEHQTGLTFPLIHVGELEHLLFNFNEKKKKRLKANTLTDAEIHHSLAQPDFPEDKRARFNNELSRRHAVALAPLAFALIGIPLGISSQRRESSSGFALSIAIALGYFIFHILGDEARAEEGPHAMILYWAPNLLALFLGAWLFYRARSK